MKTVSRYGVALTINTVVAHNQWEVTIMGLRATRLGVWGWARECAYTGATSQFLYRQRSRGLVRDTPPRFCPCTVQ